MNGKLNIAFFGSSLVSAYWNGAATYYRGMIRAVAARGHHVTFYEPDAFDRQKHRDMEDPDWATVVVYRANEEAVFRCLEAARSADVIVKASGVGVFDELLEREVLSLKTADNTVIFWDVDAPATLERLAKNSADPFTELVPRYDMVFTYGGGPPVVEAYRSFKARECVPIYNALDPKTHHPAPRDERFSGTLGFLGNRMPDREQRVHDFFFRAAQIRQEDTFLLGGNGWEQHAPQLPNLRYLGHVYTREHNAFNCTPKAVLNISRESMARMGYSPATRVFEAAGAGACLITDAWEGIEQFLAPEEETLVAASGEEVAEHLARLTVESARQMGSRARRRVLADHTYSHRARLVEELLTGAPAKALP